MRNFTKLMLTAILLVAGMGGVNSVKAKTLDVVLSGELSQDDNAKWTWDSENSKAHFEWTGIWSNAVVMPGLTGNLSDYTTVNWDAEVGTGSGVKNHFRILIYYSNGAVQTTYNPGVGDNPMDMTGEHSVTFADMGVVAANLAYVSSIKISGADDRTGDVYIKSFSLTGPDVVPIEATKVYTAPAGTTDLNGMKGADSNKWSIAYPKEVAPQGEFVAGDLNSDSRSVNILSYHYLQLVVTRVDADKKLSLRVFVSEESHDGTDKRHCLYVRPIADVADDTNWEEIYYITEPGTYVVKISGYPLLRGVKGGNGWGGDESNGTITISQSYLSSDNPVSYKDTGKYVLVGKDNTGATSLTTALADATATSIDATGLTNTSAIELTSANPNCLFIANSGKLSNTSNVIVSGNCAQLALTDGYPFKAPVNFTAGSASYTTTINAKAQAGTLCLPFEATIPAEGVTAYTLAYASGNEATATPVETTIPANTPVLLNGSGSQTFTGSSVAITAGAAKTSEAMTGVYESTTVPQNSFVLQKQGDNVGFYKVASNDITISPFRAYMTAQNQGARIKIVYPGEITAVKKIAATKCKEGVVYNLNGQRITKATKGLYLMNGKKYVK